MNKSAPSGPVKAEVPARPAPAPAADPAEPKPATGTTKAPVSAAPAATAPGIATTARRGNTAGAKEAAPGASGPATASAKADPGAAPAGEKKEQRPTRQLDAPDPSAKPATASGISGNVPEPAGNPDSSPVPGAAAQAVPGGAAKQERFVATPQDPAASLAAGTKVSAGAKLDAPAEAQGAPADLAPANEAPAAVIPDASPGARTDGLMAALMIVSFVLEVALMGALGIWGLTMLSLGPAVAVIVAVVPVLVFWAIFMSPKASLRLPQPYHAVVAHVLFAGGAILLAVSGQPVLAVCMGGLTAISLALTAAVRGQNVVDRRKSTGRRAAR